jgi:LCP family protein required for cell wall assembly
MKRVTLARSTYSSLGFHTIVMSRFAPNLALLGTLSGNVAKTIQETRSEQASAPGTPSHRFWRLPVALFAALSLLVAGGAGYGFWFYTWANSQLQPFTSKAQGPGQLAPIGGPCLSSGCNVLILGSDSRAGLSVSQQRFFGSTQMVSGHRSDTIMVLHLDPNQKKAVVLSFPRDMWVNIPHQGMGKITSAYEGGPDRVAQVVEHISGLHINHLVAVNLAGFQDVVNALGGVPICVDRPMFDVKSNLNLPHAGCYNLNGFQALAFVRARHVQGDCIPDFSRIARQQQFLRAVLAKILSKSELLHAQSLIQEAFKHLTVDSHLTVADLVYLTSKLKGISTGATTFAAVPGTPQNVDTSIGIQNVVVMDPEAKVIFKRLREGLPLGTLGNRLGSTATSPANVTVRVIDDSSGGKGPKVASLLTRAGFDTRDTTAAGTGTTSPTAVILYRSGAKDLADVVHGYFPSLQEKPVAQSVIPGVDAAVVIPANYEGPGVTNATPGTNTPGAGAPGGPTC